MDNDHDEDANVENSHYDNEKEDDDNTGNNDETLLFLLFNSFLAAHGQVRS